MRRISSTMLVSLGLGFLTLSVVLVAQLLGFIPEHEQVVLSTRAQITELVAAQCSVAAARGDQQMLMSAVAEVARRNGDVAWASLLDGSGKTVYSVGPQGAAVQPGHAEPTGMTSVRVPIFRGGEKWGDVQILFRPAPGMEHVGPFSLRMLRLVGFVVAGSILCFSVYLRRVLRQLDPSAVVPPRVRTILDSLAEGVLILDRQQRIVLANEAFAEAVGKKPERLQGMRVTQLQWVQAESDERPVELPWAPTLDEGSTRKGAALRLRDAAGALRVLMVNSAPILGLDGTRRGAMATFDDVTSIEKINAELQQSRDEVARQNRELHLLATRDPMTGCLNRRSFLEAFEAHWARAQRDGGPLACVMVDVDHFKSINDRFGHSAGDQVLRDVASTIQAAVPQSGLVCRYGGEEFCIVLPGNDMEQACRAADQIRLAIESKSWSLTQVTVSLGVAARDGSASDSKHLLDLADKALYVSKRSGRNRVTRSGDASGVVDRRGRDGAAVEPAADLASLPSIVPASDDVIASPQFQGLATALAHRDPATAAHCRRVADLCLRIGPGLLDAATARCLEAAALLHDLGKMGVPDQILLKPGPLTPQERELMRAHDLIGVDILAAAGLPREVIWIVAAHHARHDANQIGVKAPKNLAILKAARLLAIADAFDAMISYRPYRESRTRAEALAEVRRCAGSQFDPEIAHAFIERISSDAPAAAGLADLARTSDAAIAAQLACVGREVAELVQVASSALSGSTCPDQSPAPEAFTHLNESQTCQVQP